MAPNINFTTDSLAEKINTENNAVHCLSREIPLWLILLDNIPTLLLFLIGFLIIYQTTLIGAIVFGIYALFSVVWFWAKICTYCHHFDTSSCPCGYGIISAKIFKRKENKSFKKVFRRNIGIQFPNWFIPLAVAIYLFSTNYSKTILYLTISFVIIGFATIRPYQNWLDARTARLKKIARGWQLVKRKIDN